jgi:Cu-Zn family superoxide dismutase
VRQILRVIVALFAVAALTGGGAAAFADHGSGGSSGSGSAEEHSGHHDGGDDNAGHDAGDDDGVKQQAGDDRKDHDRGPGKDDHGHDNRTADVYTLAEPQHGNPEGVAFDKGSGFFFVSATGDGSIYRGRLGDTATPVPVFIPGAAGQSATGLKVQHGKLYVAGAATGTIKVYDVDSGALLATFDTKGGDSAPTFVNDLDVTKRGDVYATDSKRPAIYHLTAEEIAAGTPAPKPIDPADVISTAPEIPFNAAPAAFNLNGIVVDDDRGDDHGDRHRHHGDRRQDKLIVVDSDTGQLFRVKVGKDGNAARKIRELQVKGGPFAGGDGLLIDRGRLLVVQGSNPGDGFPNGVVNFIDLRHGGRDGRLADQRTDASFQGPSTIARARDRYLVVNPDFATSTPPFTVTALPR